MIDIYEGYLIDLGDRVREGRERAGMTQSQLADLASVSRHTIVNIEAGRGGSYLTVVRVLAKLGLEIRIGTRYVSNSDYDDEEYAAAFDEATRNTNGWVTRYDLLA